MARVKKGRRRLLAALAVLAAVVLFYVLLQYVWPHRSAPFRPDYPRQDLTDLLAREELAPADYRLLYAQTGLGPAAIDDLLALGEPGAEQILATQERFFTPPGEAPCVALGLVTQEHRYRDSAGKLLYGVPLAPLREGDILVSFSTHTVGWKHGHAGLVMDPANGITLESVVLGSDSCKMYVDHWRTYSTMMVLRPKADDGARRQVVDFAGEYLDGIPYSLLSGIFGPKFQPVEGRHSAQCSYLPWYAWMSQGLDLDGDGGKIVTPMDLALSPNVEVVQLVGVDPARFPLFEEGEG